MSFRPARTERSSSSCATVNARSPRLLRSCWPAATSSCASGPTAYGTPADLAAAHPGLVVVSLTPYGLTGPYADRPATEFIVQAEAGAVACAAPPAAPFQMGGRTWSGSRARTRPWPRARRRSAPAPGRARRSRRLLDRRGREPHRHNSADSSTRSRATRRCGRRRTRRAALGRADAPTATSASTPTPAAVRQLPPAIERPDLIEDGDWAPSPTASEARGRVERHRPRLDPQHTTAEIVGWPPSCASPSRRCPTASAVLEFEQSIARGVSRRRPDRHVRDAAPSVAHRRREPAAAASPAPRLGEHTGSDRAHAPPQAPATRVPHELPLARREGARPHRVVGRSVGDRRARRARRRRDPRRVGQPHRRHAHRRRRVRGSRAVVGVQRALPVRPTPTSATSPSTSAPTDGRRARAAPDRAARRRARELHAAGARATSGSTGTQSTRPTRGASWCACPRSA